MYVIKTFKLRSSLRNLIRKFFIFFINKNVSKKLKVLGVFLSNKKNWRVTRPPPPVLFSQNFLIKTMRKPFSQEKRNMQI